MVVYWFLLGVIVFFLILAWSSTITSWDKTNEYRVKLANVAKRLEIEGVIKTNEFSRPTFLDDWIDLLDKYEDEKNEETRLRNLAIEVKKGYKLLSKERK